MCKRINHAAVSIKVTHNRVWIIVNGGFNADTQPDGNAAYVTGANVTVLVELGTLYHYYSELEQLYYYKCFCT